MTSGSTQPPGDGPVMEGSGPAWPPPPGDDPPPAPKWTNGRAFPAVWRDTLSFSMGGVLAGLKEFPHLRLGSSWNYAPPCDSEADIDQAIQAKVHLGVRLLPLMAQADLIALDPSQVVTVPDWHSDDDEAAYSGEANLPRSPVFLDLEGIDGSPLAWRQDSWPYPFFLRGALCWTTDDLLSIIPFGSLGEQHPWGGTDYQTWARWTYLQGHSGKWPEPGPGDFLTRVSGDVVSWVEGDAPSICAHQGSIAFNLCRKVLSILMFLEAKDIHFGPDTPSRQVRRRAERQGESVGLIPRNWPTVALPPQDEIPAVPDAPPSYAPGDVCQIPDTHARLIQCHAMWHDALGSYSEPDRFVGHLNATIQGLRTVTLVLQKELKHHDGFEEWYSRWQAELKNDPRMKWLVEARNQVEKQGDLDVASTARVRVLANWLGGPIADMEVDPTEEAHEIARAIQLPSLPPRVRREGVLEVERRWTLEELADDEVLDVLAHCYGVLKRLVRDAHRLWDDAEAECELGIEALCEGFSTAPHPSSRVPCMVASRRSRTVLRNLQSGALIDMEMNAIGGPTIGREEVLERYGENLTSFQPPREKGLFGLAEVFHLMGRRFLAVDGRLETVVWLLRDGHPLRQIALEPQDQREKYLAIARVAEEVDRLGADAVVFTTEVWEAPALDSADSRAEMRPGEREDRTEAMVTYAISRDDKFRLWRSGMTRDDAGNIELGEMSSHEDGVPLFFQPVFDVWSGWAD
jgi:hypothetical protein